MKNSIVISILFIALLASCSPEIRVAMDYDRQADFSRYKTYSFAPQSNDLQVNELNKRRILENVERQLATRGLTKADAGDLLVDVRLTAQERREATAYSTGGYGGYRYGGGFQSTNVSVQTYVDGTLIISLVDAARKELVWQGTGVKTLDKDATAQQREQSIENAVSAILKGYPPVAKK